MYTWFNTLATLRGIHLLVRSYPYNRTRSVVNKLSLIKIDGFNSSASNDQMDKKKKKKSKGQDGDYTTETGHCERDVHLHIRAQDEI